MYEDRPALGREDLARYPGFGTLRTMMEARYPLGILRRVGCIIFDEQWIRTGVERRWVLENTTPEELERVEVLEFALAGARAMMLRVYTREFFQQLVATNTPLRRPFWHEYTEVCG